MAVFPFTSKKKSKTALLLDIGTETVKALLFQKIGTKINVLASSFEYFDRFGTFDTLDFEKDVMERTILKVVRKLGQIPKGAVTLGLPADILKARVVHQDWKRSSSKKIIDEKEEKDIYQKVIAEAKKNISHDFRKKTGILATDLKFMNLKIIESKIDGYEVPTIRKYDGQDLNFGILATFLPVRYLEKIKNIIESAGLQIGKIVHEVEGLNSFFTKKGEGIYMDIGGKITQIFLVKQGILEQVSEFPMGGQIFSKAISEKLGLTEAETRILKERYSKKELSKESSDRMGEILEPVWQIWFGNLKLKLKEMTIGYLPAGEIVIFGGGSQLSNTKDIFITKGKDTDLSFGSKIEILEHGQETPLLLMAHAL